MPLSTANADLILQQFARNWFYTMEYEISELNLKDAKYRFDFLSQDKYKNLAAAYLYIDGELVDESFK